MPHKKFRSQLIRLTSSTENRSGELGWKVIDVPFDVKKAFGKGGTVPVRGTINGFEFRGSLFPRKDGPHMLLTNKAMQKGAGGIELGDTVTVELELDSEERIIETPQLLKDAFDGDEELLAYFESLPNSMRKFMSESITTPKTPGVAERRAAQLAETLLEMQDGEREAPPYFQAEFARNPKAKLGWERLPVSHRRSHLWGVAYYRSAEAREKRIAKAIEMMVEYGEKHVRKK